jgi:hypothetical protein
MPPGALGARSLVVPAIEAADPYPFDYDDTVERNVRGQESEARPTIANHLPTIDRYDTVLLGSPIWNVRSPMIMMTFADRYFFSGKTVPPFVTYALSGIGDAERDFRRACRGARIKPGLAIRGEKARGAGGAVDSWLRGNRLLS